jgi:Tfp pilus assembly protein PilO
MRPLQPREKVIVWFLAALVLVIGFYYFSYAPKMKDIETVSRELKTKQDELTQLRAQAARREQLQKRLQDLQQQLQETEAKLPPSREIPALLVQLEGLASQAKTTLTLIRPGPPQAQGGPQQQRPNPNANPGQALAPSLGLQQFSVEMNVEGTFDSLESFLRGIENFPRYIAMSDMKITPLPGKPGENPERPRLALGLTTTTYYVPEGGPGR